MNNFSSNQINEQKKFVPYIVPIIDGSFDCYFWEYKTGKYIPRLKNIEGYNEAKIFIENQFCQMYVEMIQRWLTQQEYIRVRLTGTQWLNIRPSFKRLGEYLLQLGQINLTQPRLAFYLKKYIIPVLENCSPSKKAKSWCYYEKMLNKLNTFVQQVDTKPVNLFLS